MNVAKLQNWLTRHASKGPLCVLAVEPLEGSPIAVAQWESRDVRADDIVDAAQDHADGAGQAQRYRLSICNEDGTRIFATKGMRVEPDDGVEVPTLGGRTEDATAQGIVAQSLRHNEVLTKMFLASLKPVLDAQAKTIDAFARENHELRQRVRAMEQARESGDASPEAMARAESIVRVGDAIAEHLIPFVTRNMNGAGAPEAH